MSRHFYTDPLAAAWMAKHFGMKFNHPESDKFAPIGTSDAVDAFINGQQEDGRFMVHPDSLHLLEPQKDDLLHIVRGFCSHFKVVADVAKANRKNVSGVWAGGEHWDITTKEPLHDWEIIQRNGKAFHWPESEAI